jgi:hypothetical protein
MEDHTTIDCGLLFEFVSKLGCGISNPGEGSAKRFEICVLKFGLAILELRFRPLTPCPDRRA